jgi:5'-3' exonuclease
VSPAPLLVVDAPFLLYRSFFALPEAIRGADGQPVNALLGAVNNLLRVAAQTAPRSVVVCFGAESAAYRVELYAGYHAARPPMPDTLRWQFEQAPALVAALGWQVESSETLEADDLLGSLGLVEQAAGGATLILTGDRDMYQCVSEAVSVLYLRQGSSGFEIVDPPEVERRYGVTPAQVPDFIALRGDPSDGLPGAPGIGEKTAADLLRRHGSLEAAIAAARGERPRTPAALTEHAAALRAYRKIALLRTVDLERPPDTEVDFRAGSAAAAQLGMGQLAGRLEAAKSLADL